MLLFCENCETIFSMSTIVVIVGAESMTFLVSEVTLPLIQFINVWMPTFSKFNCYEEANENYTTKINFYYFSWK